MLLARAPQRRHVHMAPGATQHDVSSDAQVQHRGQSAGHRMGRGKAALASLLRLQPPRHADVQRSLRTPRLKNQRRLLGSGRTHDAGGYALQTHGLRALSQRPQRLPYGTMWRACRCPSARSRTARTCRPRPGSSASPCPAAKRGGGVRLLNTSYSALQCLACSARSACSALLSACSALPTPGPHGLGAGEHALLASARQ